MRGHIRQRGDNTWAVILYRGRDPNTGRKKYKWYPVKGTQEDAEKLLTKLLRQVDTNTFADPGKLTLGEFLQRWLTDYCESNVEKTTLARYRGIVNNHLTPALGNMLLAKLQPLDIQGYYTQALKSGRIPRNPKQKQGDTGGLSPAGVLYHHRVLHEALKQAVTWRTLGWNPADAVKPPRKRKTAFRVLDKPQLDKLLAEAIGWDIYIGVLIGALTGMRRGEILALCWAAVDLKNGMITVRQALAEDREVNGTYTKTPKGGDSRRIDIPKKLVKALEEWKKEQRRLRKACGEGSSELNDYICTGLDGRQMTLDHLSSAFARLARKCKLNIDLKGLRHTHATLLMENGVPPKVVSERLGHADVKITLEIYSHVLPTIQKQVADVLEAIF